MSILRHWKTIRQAKTSVGYACFGGREKLADLGSADVEREAREQLALAAVVKEGQLLGHDGAEQLLAHAGGKPLSQDRGQSGLADKDTHRSTSITKLEEAVR